MPEVVRSKRPTKSVTMAKAALNNGQTLYGVNDLFIGPKTHCSARYLIQSGETSETQSSSGVIVSTGMGSTGWLRSLLTGAAAITQSAGSVIARQAMENRLKRALELPLELSSRTVATVLGNGSQVICSDTVPFCLWCAARHSTAYQAALWTTVRGLGDRDTTCAIVGGIVALRAGRESIPNEWLKAREPVRI